MPRLPNFVLFITDQQRADFLGCYGHPQLRTPNIDAIAGTGVAFDRFFVASPVCMPNRASLMTGRMPSSHGVRSLGIPLARRNVTFVELLRAAGYDTALIGKSHLQNFTGRGPVLVPPQPRPEYFHAGGDLVESVRHDLLDPFYSQEIPQFWAKPGAHISTPFYGFDHVEMVRGHGDTVGGDYTAWLFERAPNAAELVGPKNQLPHDYVCPQAVRTAVPEELYSTNYIAERAAAWLDGRTNADRPFFLMVSFPDPHHPFNPPGRFWNMYSPDDMGTPEAFWRNDWNPPPYVIAAQEEREAGTSNLTGMGTIGCSAQEAREARALTCGMISMIDEAVGHVMDAMSSVVKDEETVTIFTSDHGDHLGDHRLLLKGAEAYDQVIRVPFIWSDPSGARGTRTDVLAQTIDIPTTILERAKVEPSFGTQGISLLPAMHGGAARDCVLIQYEPQDRSGVGPHPQAHTVRNNRWRLTLFRGLEWGELYDLEEDPHEFNNLWGKPEAAGVKSEMLEFLARLQMAAIDRVPMPTGRA
jgi:arylsulfatase A-like enzyme